MKRKYEAMLLFDPAAATDWDKIKAEVDRLMERAEATVLVCGKWDERRLAYEIKGVKRGIYVLTYFEADSSKITALERDAELSEMILRSLVVRADHVTEAQMKEALASGGSAPSGDAPSGGVSPGPAAASDRRRGGGEPEPVGAASESDDQ